MGICYSYTAHFQLTIQTHMASAHSFNHCEHNRTVCQVWNFKPHAVVLRKGAKIAQITPIANTVASCTPICLRIGTLRLYQNQRSEPPEPTEYFGIRGLC